MDLAQPNHMARHQIVRSQTHGSDEVLQETCGTWAPGEIDSGLRPSPLRGASGVLNRFAIRSNSRPPGS